MDTAALPNRYPWNKGILVGQKRPLQPKNVWSIRVRLEMSGAIRELALFNLAIDSKLRACDLVKLRVEDLWSGSSIRDRATIIQKKTKRPVQFEVTEQTKIALAAYYLGEAGDVLVSDFGGNLDVSNMGGQSCLVAKTTGFVGAIVNGAIRDLNAVHELDYPVWCRGLTPITGKFRMEAIEINGPVTVHDIVVYPGDLMVADDSGFCAIPFDLVDDVLEQAIAIEAAEDVMRDLIRAKRPISELRPLFRKRYD